MTERPVQGRLIVFEGLDGVGKSTLAECLVSRLREADIPCSFLAFPGRKSRTLGRLVYDLHHDASGLGVGEVNSTSLQVLHIAAHIDAIEREIRPALHAGTWIVLDRFWWSTWVYGAAFGVPEGSLEAMIELERLHWGHVEPDVLLLVERDDGIPNDGEGFRKQILARYRELAGREQRNGRVVTLRNDSSIEDAIETLWRAITPLATQLAPSGASAPDTPQNAQLTLPEDGAHRSPKVARISPAEPTVVYDTYWNFAVERQEVFFRRLEGCPQPWTHDSILHHYKFTNAYRASDRVSQYLIRNVIYEGPQSPEGVFFRTLLFKMFNRIETWELFRAEIGDVDYSTFTFDAYDRVLSNALADGLAIYSAAYIMPSPGAPSSVTPRSIVIT